LHQILVRIFGDTHKSGEPLASEEDPTALWSDPRATLKWAGCPSDGLRLFGDSIQPAKRVKKDPLWRQL